MLKLQDDVWKDILLLEVKTKVSKNLIPNAPNLNFYLSFQLKLFYQSFFDMNREELKDYIHNVVISVQENIRETRERKSWAEKGELQHIESRLLAFNEVMQIFRATANEMGIPEKELGL